MNNLATYHAGIGQVEQAIALGEEVIKVRKATLGPNHPDTLVETSNLAAFYSRAGRVAKAIQLGEKTLKQAEANLGADHPATLTSMNNHAVALHDAGRTEEATPADRWNSATSAASQPAGPPRSRQVVPRGFLSNAHAS